VAGAGVNQVPGGPAIPSPTRPHWRLWTVGGVAVTGPLRQAEARPRSVTLAGVVPTTTLVLRNSGPEFGRPVRSEPSMSSPMRLTRDRGPERGTGGVTITNTRRGVKGRPWPFMGSSTERGALLYLVPAQYFKTSAAA
jgi:hypothetical protein